MTLKNLFQIFGKIEWNDCDPETQVQGVTSDSRKVQKNDVFVALRGTHSDGHDYLQKAIDQGACAVVVEERSKVPANFRGALMQVLEGPLSYASLLAEFYQHPEEKLISIGITGTNGKTSTSYLVEAFLNAAGISTGVMGTIDHHLQKQVWKSQLTTPDTATFYQRLHDFSDAGAKAYVMEVSSHSLKQKRVPTLFDVAVFTNFTRDHLDYHKTMEDYFASKELLFTHHLKTPESFVVLNANDSAVMKTHVPSYAFKMTFGKSADCDFSYQVKKADIDHMEFGVIENGQSFFYSSPLVGEHNVLNVLGAVAVARYLHISHETCIRALKNFSGVPGRLQRVPNSQNRHVFVDYAHTPDALEKVLLALQALTGRGRIITVFGCGGDRDAGKRPLMRQVAEKYSDVVVVTSDNPRSEDPQKIIQEILAGQPLSQKLQTEVDREKAFRKALQLSQDGDVLLLAGKGHEDYQIIGTQTLPFSDYEVMKSLLTEKI